MTPVGALAIRLRSLLLRSVTLRDWEAAAQTRGQRPILDPLSRALALIVVGASMIWLARFFVGPMNTLVDTLGVICLGVGVLLALIWVVVLAWTGWIGRAGL